MIATWSLLIGGSWIAYAITAQKRVSGAWSIALGGVLLLLLGVLLLISPGAGAIGITWAIGWLVFLFGTVAAFPCVGRPSRDARAGRTDTHHHHASRTRGELR